MMTDKTDSAEHTELMKWRVSRNVTSYSSTVVDAIGNPVADVHSILDADFIVKACNAYHSNQQTIAELEQENAELRGFALRTLQMCTDETKELVGERAIELGGLGNRYSSMDHVRHTEEAVALLQKGKEND